MVVSGAVEDIYTYEPILIELATFLTEDAVNLTANDKNGKLPWVMPNKMKFT